MHELSLINMNILPDHQYSLPIPNDELHVALFQLLPLFRPLQDINDVVTTSCVKDSCVVGDSEKFNNINKNT
jgi:hypothetical protein